MTLAAEDAITKRCCFCWCWHWESIVDRPVTADSLVDTWQQKLLRCAFGNVLYSFFFRGKCPAGDCHQISQSRPWWRRSFQIWKRPVEIFSALFISYEGHVKNLNVSCWSDGSPSMLLYRFGVQAGFPRPHTLFQTKLLPKTLQFWLKKNIPQKGRKRFFYGSNMVDNRPKRAKKNWEQNTPIVKKDNPPLQYFRTKSVNPYYVLCDRRPHFCSILYLWNIYDRRWHILVQRSRTSPILLYIFRITQCR